jgi:hypothetical protein
MLTSPVVLLVPTALTLALAFGLRAVLGAERGARYGGVVAAVAFLVAWGAIVRPGWFAYDAVGRIGHIVVGAALIGFVHDAWLPRRWFLTAGTAAFVAVSAWAEANGGLWPYGRPGAATVAAAVLAAAAGGIVLWRLDRLRAAEHPFMPAGSVVAIVLIVLAAGLAAVAAAAEDAPLLASALVLAFAAAGAAVWGWIAASETVPAATLLPLAGAALAITWALFERSPFAGPGLALVAFVLFANGTARRIRLPQAGISRLLAPAILIAIALAPVALAAAATVALRGPR